MHNFEKRIVVVYLKGWFYIKDNAGNYLQEGSTKPNWTFAGKKNAIGYLTRESAEEAAKEEFGFSVIRQLTVLIETTSATLEFISRAHDALVAERESLLKETTLTEISFLRGGLEFCLTALRKPRDYPAIAIADLRTYANADARDSMLNAGAALVFNMPEGNQDKFIARVHECVLTYLGQR